MPNSTKILLLEASTEEQNEHETIRVDKLVTIPAETESPVDVVSSKYGQCP